jgi:pimeloyl-ACP methyl ester carboxylesterase
LRSPSPRLIYRRLLIQGMGAGEVAAAPGSLIEALRLSARRPQNARTIASLMHAINHFRRPRPESVLSSAELARIATPATFILGSDDPYLSPERARPSIQAIPSAVLHEVPGGHAPWLIDPVHAGKLVTDHGRPVVSGPNASATACKRSVSTSFS